MELRWTEEAADDLERIADYLFENAPGRAADLVAAIYSAPSRLLKFPYSCFQDWRTSMSTKSPVMWFMSSVFCKARRNGHKLRKPARV
jgi:plasmid stabilization system protein ParE